MGFLTDGLDEQREIIEQLRSELAASEQAGKETEETWIKLSRSVCAEQIEKRDCRIAELEKELEALKGRAICLYCGHETLRGIGSYEQFLDAIKAHVLECNKRPEAVMAAKLAERDSRIAELEESLGHEDTRARDAEDTALKYWHRQIGELAPHCSGTRQVVERVKQEKAQLESTVERLVGALHVIANDDRKPMSDWFDI